VYIIHIAVMGPIALVLLNTNIPAILKYPILALTTYAASNLIVYASTKMVKRSASTPAQKHMPRGTGTDSNSTPDADQVIKSFTSRGDSLPSEVLCEPKATVFFVR
jgi:hypothetical protein